MARYKEVSEQVFAIFHEFTPLVEGLSLDEAFLDVTASQQLLGRPRRSAPKSAAASRAQTGLTASVGIAPNKLLAKIASDLNKPDGMCRIDAGRICARSWIRCPSRSCSASGRKTLPAVHAAGIADFGDAAHGRAMRCSGAPSASTAKPCAIVPRASMIGRLKPDREEKSISAEETFATDIRGAAQLECAVAAARRTGPPRGLRAQQLCWPATVNVKIRRADFTTYTRQRALEPPTQDTAVVSAAAKQLCSSGWLASQPRAAVRLLGVGVGDLQTLHAVGPVLRGGCRLRRAAGLGRRRDPRTGSGRAC